MKTFSLDKTFRSAWANFSKHAWFFIGLTVLVLGVSIVGQYLTDEAVRADSGAASLLTLITALISVALGIWTTKVSIETVDGQIPTFSDIVPSWEVFWKYLLSSLLVGIIIFVPIAIGFVVAGMGTFSQLFSGTVDITADFTADFSVAGIVVGFLFVLSSVYLSVRLMFAQYLVIDKKVGPIDSIEKGFAMTKGSFWQLFLFLIAIALLNILGIIALLVGLLITIPLTILATAYVYREFSQAVLVPTPGLEIPSAENTDILPPTPDL